MQIELRCPRCPCRFKAPQNARAEEVRGKMEYQGTWSGLTEGATFEDMLYSGLVRSGYIGCPKCGSAASIDQTPGRSRPAHASATR